MFLQVDPVEGGVENSYVYPPDPVNDFDLSGQFSLRGVGQWIHDNSNAIGIGLVAVGLVACMVATAGVCAGVAIAGSVAGAAVTGITEYIDTNSWKTGVAKAALSLGIDAATGGLSKGKASASAV